MQVLIVMSDLEQECISQFPTVIHRIGASGSSFPSFISIRELLFEQVFPPMDQ